MEKPNWVYEIIKTDEDEWTGNQLYDDFKYAKFCAEQDYREDFGNFDGDLTWDFLCKGYYLLWEDNIPTDVELRVRHVNSLEKV